MLVLLCLPHSTLVPIVAKYHPKSYSPMQSLVLILELWDGKREFLCNYASKVDLKSEEEREATRGVSVLLNPYYCVVEIHTSYYNFLCMDIYQFLVEHSINYERVDHPPVFTCEEAEQLVPPMAGADTKNLLVRDKKGRRHFLIAVRHDRSVDLKALSLTLGVSNLSFASSERLKKYLGVEPGAVSLLAVVNDIESAVEVILDADLWKASILRCHPLVNTSKIGRASCRERV